jgi:hypothetical protein
MMPCPITHYTLWPCSRTGLQAFWMRHTPGVILKNLDSPHEQLPCSIVYNYGSKRQLEPPIPHNYDFFQEVADTLDTESIWHLAVNAFSKSLVSAAVCGYRCDLMMLHCSCSKCPRTKNWKNTWKMLVLFTSTLCKGWSTWPTKQL